MEEQKNYSPPVRQQLFAILKRNLIIKKRTKGTTIQEIVVPLMFVCCLLVIPNETSIYEPTKNLPENQFGESPYPFLQARQILAYAPQNVFTTTLMTNVANALNTDNIGFVSEGDIDDFRKNNTLWAAVVFDISSDASDLPKDLQYEIKMDTSGLPNFDTKFVSDEQCRVDSKGSFTSCSSYLYFSSGFVYLQQAIDQHIISYGSTNITQQIFTKLAPANSYRNTQTVASYLFPIYLVLAFTPFIQFMLLRIVAEKEKKLKQGMEVMGLSDQLYWASWFLTYSIIIFVFVIIFLVVGSVGGIWPKSNKIILFILFYLFGLCSITMGFVVSVFVTSSKAAGGVASLVMMLMSVINLGLQQGASNTVCWIASIFSPVSFTLAISEVLFWEGAGVGVQWKNVNEINGIFAIQSSIIMLALDLIFYLVLSWYLGRVWPSQFGVQEPWWFPVKFLISKITRRKYGSISRETLIVNNENQQDMYEHNSDNHNQTVSLELDEFSKTFKNSKAVDGLSLKVYEGEIFALLGHNGAGKTTTISMLTGFIPPTSGTATICGFDLQTEIRNIRQQIGMCPQHDLLFDELTVREHLSFYGNLRGLDSDTILSEIIRLTDSLSIDDKLDVQSNQLSGGMKRKLSLAIAMIGDPKILILDEPTSGMDPYSRRQVWELLIKAKKGKTIILTTHYMDEADFLADRVGIMANGKLKCLGSTLFLKNRFGVHYYLNVERKEETDVSSVESIVSEHIPTATWHETTRSNLSYALPLKEVAKFPDLLLELETKADELQIGGFGVTLTTLEEVFLKIASENDNNETTQDSTTVDVQVDVPTIPAKSRRATTYQQMKSIAKSKVMITLRQPSTIVCGVVIPIILVFVGSLVYYTNKNSNSVEKPILAFSPSLYSSNSPLQVPIGNFTENSISLSGSSDVSYLYANSLNPSSFEQFLFDNQPHIGAFGISQWEPVSKFFNYSITFNSTAVHSLPVLFNIMSNALLKSIHGEDYSISTSLSGIGNNGPGFDGSQFAGTFLLGFSILFTPIGFMGNLVRDCSSGFKRQLVVMGVRNSAYWLTVFLFDWAMYLLVAIATFICVGAFGITFSGPAFGVFVLLVLLNQLAMLAFSYLLSFAFKSHETVYRIIPMIYQLLSMVPAITVMILSYINEDTRRIAKIIHYTVGAIDTPYTLMGTLNFIALFPLERLFQGKPSPNSSDYFNEPTIYMGLVYSAVQFVIYSVLVYYFDFFRYFSKRKENSSRTSQEHLTPIEEDVAKEMKVVDSLDRNQYQDNVVVKHLGKEYNSVNSKTKKKEIKIAVNDLCLKIPVGECFGLLGPNGAGKSSSLAMMTGDLSPTFGTVMVDGYDILKDLSHTYELTGYCPQHDPFPPDLTGAELLQLFAQIKGFSVEESKILSSEFATMLGISQYMSKITKGYSGGTKRKLSVAIALISSPKIVYLDEASAGIDPASKHYLWAAIKSGMQSRVTIMTTHSMEEAQALCTKIGIMVNGELQCIGSAQHLKNKFGSGYNLEIKSSQDLSNIIIERFPEATIDESLNGHVKFNIPKTKATVSEVFRTLVKLSQQYPIDDYAVSQSTLEQVFIKFAKQQKEEFI